MEQVLFMLIVVCAVLGILAYLTHRWRHKADRFAEWVSEGNARPTR